MKIAIISDVHNNTVNLKKVLDYCKKESASRRIETIICCGDLASAETLDFLNDYITTQGSTLAAAKVEPWKPVVHYTFGNMDKDHLNILTFKHKNKYKNIVIYKDYGEIKIENNQIAFVHYPNTAEDLCRSGKYDFVFYGHTHKPFEKNINSCKMLNPGNVAGEIYPPTFAVWETENNKFELIRIHELK